MKNDDWKESIESVNEMARRWDMSPHYLKILCSQNKVDAKKVGKTWVVYSKQERPDIKQYHWNKKNKKEN